MPTPSFAAIALRAVGYPVLLVLIVFGSRIWAGESWTHALPWALFVVVFDAVVTWGRVRRDAIRKQRGDIVLNDVR